MKRFATALFALTFATSASAMVLSESATPHDPNETFYDENAEFVGDPLVDANGEILGTVIGVHTTASKDRMIVVKFNEPFPHYSGWMFKLDDKWESGGTIEIKETRDELIAILDQVVARNPGALHSPAAAD